MPISNDFLKVPTEHMIGQVIDLREDEGDYGPQLVVEFLPLGAEEPRLKWYNAATAHGRRSGWQRFLKALRAVGVDTTDPNNIIGAIVKIQLVENSFTGTDGEERTYDVWKAVRLYESETEALEDLAEITEAQGESTPAPTGIDAEILEAAKTVFAALGKNVDAFTPVAASSWPGVDTKALVAAVS